MQEFDVIVIGGGPAGLVASKFLVAFGKKVALVEREKLGGDCTHSGCIPSKTLLKSAKAYHDAKKISAYGLKGDIDIDTSGVLLHVRNVVASVYAGETPEVFEAAGVHIIKGFASFLNKNEIKVNEQTYRASKFIIATGARADIPPIKGLDTVAYLSNETVFLQEKIPDSLIIIGTGAIGIEMATAFNRLGSRVTLLARGNSILKENDAQHAALLLASLLEEGVNFIANAEYIQASQDGNTKSLQIKQNGIFKTISADAILIATGRAANTDLKLENAGVIYDKKGIKVDAYLQTTNPNIYAIGDVATPYKFTHVAEMEAIKAASNIVLPLRTKISYEHIGWCIYAEPELAQIGLTPQNAQEKYGQSVQTVTFSYKHTDRAYTDVDAKGSIKVSVLNNGKIVGASILGARAGELIHQLQLAKTLDISFEKLSKMLYLYPTYADIIKQPAKQFYIHKLRNNPWLKALKSIASVFTKTKS
ncbi:MAG: FAD-dependent oxidoreductase [Sulfurospirillum sp.]|nr:FAD-dependent oxidoreductase [Sulfurospirillum sp.]